MEVGPAASFRIATADFYRSDGILITQTTASILCGTIVTIIRSNIKLTVTYTHLNSYFDFPGLAGCPLDFRSQVIHIPHRIGWVLRATSRPLALTAIPKDFAAMFLRARCPSCHPTNRVKTLNAQSSKIPITTEQNKAIT